MCSCMSLMGAWTPAHYRAYEAPKQLLEPARTAHHHQPPPWPLAANHLLTTSPPPRPSASNHPPPHHPTTEPTIGRRALLPRSANPVPMSCPSITPAHCSTPPWPQRYPLASAAHRYHWRTTTATVYFFIFYFKICQRFFTKIWRKPLNF